MPPKKNDPVRDKEPEDFPEVESNHNTLSPAKPIPNGNLLGSNGEPKPDYNPMRAPGNKANNASDVTHTPETSAALIEAKGDRPSPTAPDAIVPEPGSAEAEEVK